MKKLWEKIKAWFIKNWFMLINYLVVIATYFIIYGHEGVILAEVLLGLWLLVSAGYAGYKWFTKKKPE